MNIYTVGKATQGLVEYILSRPGAKKRVAIAHDSRINSRLFAVRTACVLAANGVMAYLYPAPGAHPPSPGRCVHWNAMQVCALRPATTRPGTMVIKCTGRTAAKSQWRQPKPSSRPLTR